MYQSVLLLAVAVACVAGSGFIHPMTEEEIAKSTEIAKGTLVAVEKLNAKNSRKENQYRLVHQSIKSASRQVVSGMLYRVEVKLVSSTCLNTDENANKGLEECPANGNGIARLCRFDVWSRPWLKEENRKLMVTGAIHCTVN